MTLTIENSWWFSGGLWQDFDLKMVENSHLSYHPRPISIEECTSESVLTLRGPRRAGKTIALKLLIAELIEKHAWNGRDIVWVNFDTLRTLSEAETTLRGLTQKHKPKLLVIDEITTLKNWQLVIKKLRDEGILSKMTILLTGSSAHDLKAGAERMAGRRGDVENPDRILLPMSFATWKEQLNFAEIGIEEEKKISLYLEVGGFPFRLNQWIKKRKNDEPWSHLDGFQVFDDILFYEFTRRRLDRNIVLEIIARLSQIKNTSASFESFSKPLTISRDTAQKYLAALGDSFLLATLSSYDTSRNRVAVKKEKKFLWIDPVFRFMAESLGQGDAAEESAAAEWAVGAFLLKSYERRLWEGLSAPRNVFTWKSSGGNEIDFLIIDKTKKIINPIEVKYQNSISDWDFQIMERAFKKGTLVTKKTDYERPLSAAHSLSNFLISF